MEIDLPRLNLIVLRSVDIHRAVEFYRAIGLQFTLERHGDGPEHFASAHHGLVVELYPLLAGASPSTGTRIGFQVDSVEVVLDRLLAFGTKISVPPHDSSSGRRAVVVDLDGHKVELVSQS